MKNHWKIQVYYNAWLENTLYHSLSQLPFIEHQLWRWISCNGHQELVPTLTLFKSPNIHIQILQIESP